MKRSSRSTMASYNACKGIGRDETSDLKKQHHNSYKIIDRGESSLKCCGRSTMADYYTCKCVKMEVGSEILLFRILSKPNTSHSSIPTFGQLGTGRCAAQ